MYSGQHRGVVVGVGTTVVALAIGIGVAVAVGNARSRRRAHQPDVTVGAVVQLQWATRGELHAAHTRLADNFFGATFPGFISLTARIEAEASRHMARPLYARTVLFCHDVYDGATSAMAGHCDAVGILDVDLESLSSGTLVICDDTMMLGTFTRSTLPHIIVVMTEHPF